MGSEEKVEFDFEIIKSFRKIVDINFSFLNT